LPVAPIMIYGDDVTHVVTEEGVAYLFKAKDLEERREALAAIAGVSSIGPRSKPERVRQLRRDGLVAYPEDLGVHVLDARRSLLAARSIDDLVAWSGGLYDPLRNSKAGSLIEEANLTPKPGLVDRRGGGAHTDMTLEMMYRSAYSLFPTFKCIARIAEGKNPSVCRYFWLPAGGDSRRSVRDSMP
jgi:hypothetical protein